MLKQGEKIFLKESASMRMGTSAKKKYLLLWLFMNVAKSFKNMELYNLCQFSP